MDFYNKEDYRKLLDRGKYLGLDVSDIEFTDEELDNMPDTAYSLAKEKLFHKCCGLDYNPNDSFEQLLCARWD